MTAPQPDDPIWNEWFTVCASATLPVADTHAATILGTRVIAARSDDGTVAAYEDQCPHRGAQLSLGGFDGTRLSCPYHGWQFDGGRCVFQPAHPTLTPPPHITLRRFETRERYGLVWVCLGAEPRNLTDYAPYDKRPDRNVIYGPVELASCGPRIIENFLDMAHFPFVHPEYLGRAPHTEVYAYEVSRTPERVEIAECQFWQPNPGPHARQGGIVRYRYWVDTPYAAALDKFPALADGGEAGAFSIMLVASPIDEFTCRAWMITSAHGDDMPLQTFYGFNEIIFRQDISIVESQRPKRLPLEPTAERHQAADKMALNYRAWLRDRGVRYGTSANAGSNVEP